MSFEYNAVDLELEAGITYFKIIAPFNIYGHGLRHLELVGNYYLGVL